MSTNNQSTGTEYEVLKTVYNKDGSERCKIVKMPLSDLKDSLYKIPQKKWRNKILRFYGKDATFIYDDCPLNQADESAGIVVQQTFEPCVLGKVVSCQNGVLEFATDRGSWFVKFRSRTELRKMLTDSKMDANGRSKRAIRMMSESYKRHGDLAMKALGLEDEGFLVGTDVVLGDEYGE
tara:strand:- start:175 stop:711 length:537 start_codon:yes stop_codon:yes gene_type:complete